MLVLCLLSAIFCSEPASFRTNAYASRSVQVVQKNIDRIELLPERACLFAFTAWHGYIMIALMIMIGFTLRNSALPMYYLSIPYTAMGGTLLIGSLRYYRRFLADLLG